jgi:D-amino-acid dehydrogenase
MSYDAIVVGGGIVGTAIAYHLVRGGARTLLLDRADPGRAWRQGCATPRYARSAWGCGRSG